MHLIRTSLACGLLLAVSSLAPIHAHDSIDQIISSLDERSLEAMLEGVDPDAVPLGDGRTLRSEFDTYGLLGFLPVSDVWSAGSSVVVPRGDPNDPVWVVNASAGVWGEISRLTATIDHGGFLRSLGSSELAGYQSEGWGHLAVLARGTSVDATLRMMGIPVAHPVPFFWGERAGERGLPGGEIGPELSDLFRGRGPTFWAAGERWEHSDEYICNENPAQACMIFENYSMHHEPGDVLIGRSIPVQLHSGSFELRVEVTDHDVQVWVWQDGQQRLAASCRQSNSSDFRCGRRPWDRELGDAMFGFVMKQVPAHVPNRAIGARNIRSQVLQWQAPTCPGCVPH